MFIGRLIAAWESVSETLIAVLSDTQKLIKNPFAEGKCEKIANIGNLGIEVHPGKQYNVKMGKTEEAYIRFQWLGMKYR